MAYFLFGFLLALGTCTQVVQPRAEKCSPEWKTDWNIDVAFDSILPSPGVLIGGNHPVTFPELIEFVGRLWNAESPLELSGYVCRDYVPYIYALLDHPEMEEYKNEIRTTCDKTISMLKDKSNTSFQQDCLDEFDATQFEKIIQNYVKHSLYFGQSCTRPSYDRVYFNTSNILCSLVVIGVENLLDLTATASRVVFDVLDWLTPTPFSGDVFGGCAGLRLMSNMNIDDIVMKLKSIVSYFVADGLMYFRDYDGCDVVDRNIIHLVDNTLFYGQTGGICAFLSGNPSENENKNKAFQIIDNLLPVPSNIEQCVNLMDWMVDQFELIDDSFHHVTGFDIATRDGRRSFCNQVLDSLSSNTQYTPEIYIFPLDHDLSSWKVFKGEGEFLPGFDFTDGMDLVGAILNSATVIDGANVLCTVFESFLTIASKTTYPRRLCAAFKRGNTKSVETICREIAVPSQYGKEHLISIRPPTLAYVIVVGVDVARKLFKLNEVSTNAVCRASDDFHNSDNNLRSIVESILSGYYAELLPITDDICNDYDDVIRYFRRKSYLQDEEFTKLVDEFSELILTILGSSDSINLCKKISDGISQSTGRSNKESISYFVNETLRFLTDERRCGDSIDAALPFLQGASLNINQLIKTYTGYDDKASLCKAFASSFVDECAVSDSVSAVPDSANASSTSWYLMVSGLILAKILSSLSSH